ncbi:hypothetical protein PInf_002791 [Phytophthora infestans]|nr:hypothetical protein PInf_002791 [Phytophthora infestans]
MVAPTPKTPRHHLTEQERRLCREALLSERHERRIRRTEQKSGSDGAWQTKAKKATKKKAAKRTTADMEVAQYKGLYIPSASAQVADTAGEKEGSRNQTIAEAKETIETTAIADAMEVEADHEMEVTEVVADMVLSRSTQVPTREHRRALLQEDSDGDDDTRMQGDEDESVYEADVVHSVPACVIDTDPNFMDEGADECTGLNSDEDPELREEPEDEEDADDDSWDGDWDIGELTDEDSDHDIEELPKTAWLSAAKNAPLITAMRTDGWEYVCAIYKVKPRKFTKYFCPECSNGNKRIWHADWNNGNDIPRDLLQEHRTRERPPASRPGKKRRRRQQVGESGASAGAGAGESSEEDDEAVEEEA